MPATTASTANALVVLALCAAVADAYAYKVIFENTGAADGLSVYYTGFHESDGASMPEAVEEEPGLEYFQSFINVGEKNAQISKWGSRFLIRAPDSKSGPGFRAAVQIQKGEGAFPFKIVTTNIANENMAHPIELIHRGKKDVDSREYLWIDPGMSAHQLTQGTQWNPFELRNQDKVPQLKIIIHQPATDELPEEKEF